jgi:hypothetical protein
MKLNIRVLTFVAALASCIAAGVVLVRSPAAAFSERVGERGAPLAGPVLKGIEIRLGAEGVAILIPNCDVKQFHDKFFLHVHPATPEGGAATTFINRDFDLFSEPLRRASTPKGEVCIVDRSYGTSQPKDVVIGQFSMPEGRCCEVIWSRNYVLGN